MNEKGRNGCPWSIACTNGGGIVGGESGTFHHKDKKPRNINKNQTKITTDRAPSVLVVPTAEVLIGSDANDDSGQIKGRSSGH